MQPRVPVAYNERITRGIFVTRGQGEEGNAKATYNSYFKHLPRPIKFLQLASSFSRYQFHATKFCRICTECPRDRDK